LAEQFAVGARVDHFVPCAASEGVGRDVTHAVAGSLHSVHLDTRQLSQHVRRFLELRPVELHVLARREVSDATVVTARDFGQLAQLACRQHAVGDGNAQHGTVALDIEAVLQA